MTRGRRLGAGVLLAGLLVAVVATLGWRFAGGGWVRVETPSMGTTAPVGSLLWLRPVTVADLAPGDLVTFRSPDAAAGATTTYSHRVRAVAADGTFTTRGELSGDDRWTVTEADLVGRAVAVWPWGGWLVLMAPVLILGATLVAVGARRAPERLRHPLAVVGGAAVVCAALVVHEPLTRTEQLAFTVADEQGRATWVNTGMLPLRLGEVGGDEVDVMRPGEVAEVVVRGSSAGRYVVEVDPALPWWWWPGVAGICFVPAVAETLRRRPRLRT